MEEGGVVSMLDIFAFERKIDSRNPLNSNGSFKVISTPTRAINKMLENGIEMEKSIFSPETLISKDMLIDELKDYTPKRMCGWKEHFMAEIIQGSYMDGKNIIERWPNLKI
jgi:hypothetical protein